jgi:hypothetical protein
MFSSVVALMIFLKFPLDRQKEKEKKGFGFP